MSARTAVMGSCRDCAKDATFRGINADLCDDHRPTPTPPGYTIPRPEWTNVTMPSLHTAAVKMRRDARATSQRAGALALPRSGTQRADVLAYIGFRTRTGQGATDREVHEHMGLSLNSVRPRRLELVEMGWVVEDGERDDHTVWWVSPKALEQYGPGVGACRCTACLARVGA